MKIPAPPKNFLPQKLAWVHGFRTAARMLKYDLTMNLQDQKGKELGVVKRLLGFTVDLKGNITATAVEPKA